MVYYALIHLIFLIWTVINSMFMPKLKQNVQLSNSVISLVSVLIPLRNEERNIKRLVKSLTSMTYQKVEVIFLDDQSTDNTYKLLMELTKEYKNFKVIKGAPLANGWVGKVHACKQLGEHAKGEYLLFLDADVEVCPTIIEKTISTMDVYDAGLLTGFPKFPSSTLLSKILVPMQHYIVFFHLPIFIANRTTIPSFTAAHGAFMCFRKEVYNKIGGHSSVAASIVEDVHLARHVKQKGYRVLLANLTEDVSCYMYETNKEVWNGFSKNIFVGLGRSIPLASTIIIFYSIFFVMPFIFAILGIITNELLYLLPYMIMLLHRAIVDWKTQQRNLQFLWMPVSAMVIIILLIYSAILSVQKKGYRWKGRSYT
ncbi:glycosyltransferase [Alkalihalobacterium elongatum]|uniref:glycosyltransferase n=1 Tax=Alkalihalobacterium elongatum TaxID=2675466 RepID=UPI001C1F88AF|nr:glycosyltransferase family 2 protein [Alkalihalobacterium elongatum]